MTLQLRRRLRRRCGQALLEFRIPRCACSRKFAVEVARRRGRRGVLQVEPGLGEFGVSRSERIFGDCQLRAPFDVGDTTCSITASVLPFVRPMTRMANVCSPSWPSAN